MKNQYPDWLRKAASKGGKAKSAAKSAAAKKNAKLGGWPKGKLRKVLKELDAFEAKSRLANLVVGQRKPKRSARLPNDPGEPSGVKPPKI
jgi:hypothetical protein